METPVYNKEGKEIKKINLSKEIFGVEVNNDLLHQVVVSQMSNRRQGTAQVKDRGDVRGGGKKPWRQKGTGRARHGSRRSPIWVGGGVTFGPTNEKNYKKKITKQMKRKALSMALSSKASDDNIRLVDEFKIKEPNTKSVKGFLDTLFSKKESTLFVIPNIEESFILSIRNIPKTDVIQAKDLNALDILSFRNLILFEKSLDIIKETFFNK